ncbi:MAG: nicotinate-nucleotide--dimethylbenzimidazole phosphoribosyltransferase [Verrucomicrobia bacterium]|nr:nicotinate-nucleotide--dimethylbenzimidazole phosphoribosyltransferase [Verrucomicrobiota bacterium]MCG2681870.1 nicotinate-nucleotide--dimethylbenzimidazole phosphoribosyltransferase [Kiritimatiellia bacterium]MBU4247970.1 nicotinate-nucleotide--dimethylbenzimidazole phosphoribosyltransferase [Verrucomicrobiota bacterium]MBU4291787.1 nicotinate-nucleotide--dimethylbenzimidazole phosphoribosyltransferase [Verrucomicrobiota bacterium]MBU4430106.1 nicotinate-nucleotide--dimethylbenzimidazole p
MTFLKLYEQTIGQIQPVSPAWIDKAYQRLDSLTKPRRSLGYLEEIAARIVAILQQERPQITGRRVFVFVGDHKVVEEGVSAYPSSVTALMVKNFLAGGAAINVLARQAGARIEVIDIGMLEDLGPVKGLRRHNVKRGADNIAQGPAMTVNEVLKAVAVGIKRANKAADRNVTLLATGEMGIGNTTAAAALFSVYLNLPPAQTVGAGTGLDASGVSRKVQVVEQAITINKSLCKNALETLAALGGLEIAGICGLCLGAAARARPVVVDGFISSVGALAAMRICPVVKDYLFFAHMSAEIGHRKFFEQEKLRPLVDLGMRLGEGTGAAMAIQIIEDAVAIYNEMATFANAGIAPGA